MNYPYELSHFAPTCIEKINGHPLLFDPYKKELLSTIYHYIQKLEGFKDVHDPYAKFKFAHDELSFDEIVNQQQINLEKILNNISYISNNKPLNFYSNYEHFQSHFSDQIIGLSEKFSSALEMFNSGSSRHIMLNQADVKGAGSNLLAHRLDYGHATGALTLNDAFLDYFYGILLDFSTPLGAERVIAITEIPQGVLAFRERTCHRLCNSTVKLRFSKSIKNFKNIIDQFTDSDHFIRAHIIHITSSLFNGNYHGALNLENYLINGKFIDNQTFLPTVDCNTFQFELVIQEMENSSDFDYSNYEKFLHLLSTNKSNLIVTFNNFHNHLLIFDYLQKALVENSEHTSTDSFLIWTEVLKDSFQCADFNIELFSDFYQIFKEQIIGSHPSQVLDELDSNIAINHLYEHKKRSHILTFSFSMKKIEDVWDQYRQKQLQKRKTKFKQIQKLLLSQLKWKQKIEDFSKQIFEETYKLTSPPHFIFQNGKLRENRFTSKEELKKFLIDELKLSLSQKIATINIAENSLCETYFDDIDYSALITGGYRGKEFVFIPPIILSLHKSH